MRLRTLPLSLAGVVCGGLLALCGIGDNDCHSWLTFALVLLTACSLQVLSNLSNEMGDHLSGVDGEDREGPNYSMAEGGLSVKQMWHAINGTVVFCAISGMLMLLFSFRFSIFIFHFVGLMVLGAAAIWAATHYTLGKRPYGYIGLGDLFVFIFFGLVSVTGSYFVIAHTDVWDVLQPACGIGLLSVAVLNVNNIRDISSDEGIRKTVPILIGARSAKIYQTLLIVGGVLLMCLPCFRWWLCIPVGGISVHLWMVWTRKGRGLDPALPILVLSTFLLSILYTLTQLRT